MLNRWVNKYATLRANISSGTYSISLIIAGGFWGATKSKLRRRDYAQVWPVRSLGRRLTDWPIPPEAVLLPSGADHDEDDETEDDRKRPMLWHLQKNGGRLGVTVTCDDDYD